MAAALAARRPAHRVPCHAQRSAAQRSPERASAPVRGARRRRGEDGRHLRLLGRGSWQPGGRGASQRVHNTALLQVGAHATETSTSVRACWHSSISFVCCALRAAGDDAWRGGSRSGSPGGAGRPRARGGRAGRPGRGARARAARAGACCRGRPLGAALLLPGAQVRLRRAPRARKMVPRRGRQDLGLRYAGKARPRTPHHQRRSRGKIESAPPSRRGCSWVRDDEAEAIAYA